MNFFLRTNLIENYVKQIIFLLHMKKDPSKPTKEIWSQVYLLRTNQFFSAAWVNIRGYKESSRLYLNKENKARRK